MTVIESIIMQLDSEGISAILTAFGAVLVPIVAIVTYIAAAIRSKSGDSQQAQQVAEAFERASRVVVELGKIVQDNQRQVVDTIKALEAVPGVKEHLTNVGINSKALAADMEYVKDQLERFQKALPCLEQKDELTPKGVL